MLKELRTKVTINDRKNLGILTQGFVFKSLQEQLVDKVLDERSPEFIKQDVKSYKNKIYDIIDDVISMNFFRYDDEQPNSKSPPNIWINKFFERLETEN